MRSVKGGLTARAGAVYSNEMRSAALLFVASIGIAACASDPPQQEPSDGGVVMHDDAAVPDSGPMPPVNTCTCEATEDCTACYANIGRCCYDDPEFLGVRDLIVANCERKPACKVCCNECAARTCDEILAANDCPIQ